MKKLNAQEKIFIAEYLIDTDPQRAALAAGYSKTMARTKAYQWVSDGKRKPHVFAAVEARIQKHVNKLELKADDVLRELKLLGFSNMLDYMRVKAGGTEADLDLSKLTREQAAAIQEITVDATGGTGDGERRKIMRTRFKLAPKGENLERLGRHLKLFGDNKLEVDLVGIVAIAERLRSARKRT